MDAPGREKQSNWAGLVVSTVHSMPSGSARPSRAISRFAPNAYSQVSIGAVSPTELMTSALLKNASAFERLTQPAEVLLAMTPIVAAAGQTKTACLVIGSACAKLEMAASDDAKQSAARKFDKFLILPPVLPVGLPLGGLHQFTSTAHGNQTARACNENQQ